MKSGKYGVLMCDLRGFTAIAEQYPTLSIVPLLNHYFQVMTTIIDSHGGTIDKFMGDAVLALFNMETTQDAAYNMLSCSIDMQLAMDGVNQFASNLELPELFMGIGLNQGNVVMCELGSDIYREFTVLGDAVNMVSRMSAFALRGQVLLSEAVLDECREQVETGSDFTVLIKGKKQIIRVYELQGLHYPDRKTIPMRESRRSPRVEALLPINYFRIDNQRVQPTPVKADLADLSYGGMRIFTPQEHRLLDEIKIVIPFAIGREASSDVYAKVLSCTVEENDIFCISVEFSYMDEFARKSIKTLVDHLV